jgi:hypothetical protein
VIHLTETIRASQMSLIHSRFEARLVHPDGSWIQMCDSEDEPIEGWTLDQVCQVLLDEPDLIPRLIDVGEPQLVIVKIETTEVKPNQEIMDLMKRN